MDRVATDFKLAAILEDAARKLRDGRPEEAAQLVSNVNNELKPFVRNSR